MLCTYSYVFLSLIIFLASNTNANLNLFDKRECTLCKDPGRAVNWNYPLQYDGLASTCLDVYMNMRNEGVQDGDDVCQSIQFTLAHECCYEIPANQCSLCQSNNGTYLNTNWNSEVNYQGETVTCGDVNALLSAEELDNLICLSAREDLWNECCTPQEGGNTGMGGILPPLISDVSDSDTSSGQSGGSWGSDVSGFDGNVFFRRPNGTRSLQSSHTMSMIMMLLVGVGIGLYCL